MKNILVVLIITLAVPLIITNFFYEYKFSTGLVIKKEEKKIRVLKKDNTEEILNIEDYIIGVV